MKKLKWRGRELRFESVEGRIDTHDAALTDTIVLRVGFSKIVNSFLASLRSGRCVVIAASLGATEQEALDDLAKAVEDPTYIPKKGPKKSV